MAVRYHSSGPAAVFVSTIQRNPDTGQIGVTGPVRLLGWCEVSPEITIEAKHTPLYNTLGGVELPYTYFPQGAEALVSLTMTRWDDGVLATIENIYRGMPVLYHSVPLYYASFAIGIVYPISFHGLDVTHRSADIFLGCRVTSILRQDMGTMGEKVTVNFTSSRMHVSVRPYTASHYSAVGTPADIAALGYFGEMSMGGVVGLATGSNVGDNLTAEMLVLPPIIFPNEV